MLQVESVADIGAVIRTVRKEQGLTQTQLANLCGVGLSFVSNLERGKATSESCKVLLVMQTLGLDLFIAKRGE